MAENLEAAEAANILNDERARRLADRAALYAAGKNPYPERSSVTDHAADLFERYEHLANEEVAEETVTIGGRVVAKRGQGKIMFIVVRDPSADIQLFCRVNDVEEESWEVLKELDLGDIVQATGQVTRTKRGELSVARAPPSCCPRPSARCPRSSTVSPIRRPAIASAMSTSS